MASIDRFPAWLFTKHSGLGLSVGILAALVVLIWGAVGLAQADAESTSFVPDEVQLLNDGDSATITVATVNVDPVPSAYQINVQHSNNFTVTNDAPTGIFTGALRIAASPVVGGTAFGAFFLGTSATGATGDVATFLLTRTGPCVDGEGNPVNQVTINFANGALGVGATEFSLEGTGIGPGTLNSLNVVCSLGVNTPPEAVDNTYSTDEDTTLTVDAASGVLANDTDAEGDPLTAALVSDVSDGTLALNADGSFTYTPDADFNGSDSFTYMANDGQADSNEATVTITVNPINDAPVANDDSYSTEQDTTLTVDAASGVLANDTDVDGNDLTATLESDVSNGTLTLNSDGSFTYTPNAGFTGTDSFEYIASDGEANSNVATATITVAELVADVSVTKTDSPDPVTAGGNITYEITVTNAGPDDATGVVLTDVVPSDFGAMLDGGQEVPPVTTDATGMGHFMLNPDQTALSFEITVDLGALTSTMTLAHIHGPAPAGTNAGVVRNLCTSEAECATTFAGGTATGTWSSADAQPFDATMLGHLLAGNLYVNIHTVNFGGGEIRGQIMPVTSFVSAPDCAEAGGVVTCDVGDLAVEDSQTFTITVAVDPATPDGAVLTNTATVASTTPDPDLENNSSTTETTVIVVVENTPPVANDDAYTPDEDTTLTVDAASGVLANDTDADGNDLTAALVSDVSNGTLALNADGSFTYTPDADFNGSDSFTYMANDGLADSNEATVSITVEAVNDAPVAADDAYSTDQDTSLTVDAASGLLANDTDVDGDSLTAALVSGPSTGTLILNSDGSFTYTPNAGFSGTDSFTYMANDGQADSNVATVTITVNPVGEEPVQLFIEPENTTARVGQTFEVDVMADADELLVAGIQAFLNFDPARLQVVDADNTLPGIQIESGDTLVDSIVLNQVDNTTGQIDYAAGNVQPPGGSGFPSGTFTVATITFMAVEVTGEEDTEISFAMVPNERDTLVSDPDGNDITGTKRSGFVEIVETLDLQVRFKFEGGARPRPAGWEKEVTVELVPVGGGAPIVAEVTSVFDATNVLNVQAVATVEDVPLDTYDVYLTGPSTLTNVKRGVAVNDGPGLVVVVNLGTLRSGNANSDGTRSGNQIINILDFGVLAGAFGTGAGEEGFDSRADFDCNNVININDFGLLSKNFLAVGPVEIP